MRYTKDVNYVSKYMVPSISFHTFFVLVFKIVMNIQYVIAIHLILFTQALRSGRIWHKVNF